MEKSKTSNRPSPRGANVRHWIKNNGERFHLCTQMVRDGLHGVRDRRLRTADRRLAYVNFDEDPVRAQRAGAGALAKKGAG